MLKAFACLFFVMPEVYQGKLHRTVTHFQGIIRDMNESLGTVPKNSLHAMSFSEPSLVTHSCEYTFFKILRLLRCAFTKPRVQDLFAQAQMMRSDLQKLIGIYILNRLLQTHDLGRNKAQRFVST